MPDTPTPGQVAYAAYWHSHGLPYALLPEYARANWEAAALAVLALGMPQRREGDG